MSDNRRYYFDNFYKPLTILSNIFCLPVPKSQSEDGKPMFFVTYALAIITSLVYGLERSLNAMMILYTKDAILYLDVLIICAMVFTNVISISSCVLIRRKSMVKLVRIIGQIDADLKVNEGLKSGTYFRFALEMVILHLFAIACAVYESYTMVVVVGLEQYYAHIIFYVNLYMVILSVLKIYHISMAIKYRFSLLNRKMKRLQQFKLTLTIVSTATDDQKMVTFYRKNHLLLSECIHLMNQVFGVQILFITMLIIIFIVQAVNQAISYGKSNTENETETYELIFVCIWNTSIFIIFAFMMASSCEQVIEEKNKSQRICHKLLTQLPVRLTKTQQILREELCVFAKQIEQLDVQFSAVGFFNVNHTLLLTVFGSIAAYIIVLIQFR